MTEMVRIGPVMLPSDGRSVKVIRGWRDTGRTLTELVSSALVAYGESAEYKKVVKGAEK
jgi:hypothetical protein